MLKLNPNVKLVSHPFTARFVISFFLLFHAKMLRMKGIKRNLLHSPLVVIVHSLI
jgi:hypothetical protein